MFSLDKLTSRLDAVSEWIGRTIAWLTLGMVLVTLLIVALRYLFNSGSIALQETVIYMHAAVFMLAMGYTLRHDGHVRVDLIYNRLGPKGQALVDLLGTLLLLIPFALFIIWVSWGYVANSWALLEGSRETGGLPLVWLLKGVIPLMGVLLITQGVSQALRAWQVLRNHPESAPLHEMDREL